MIFLGLLSMVGFLIFLVTLVVGKRTKLSRKQSSIGMAVCVVIFFIAALNYSPESGTDKDTSNKSTATSVKKPKEKAKMSAKDKSASNSESISISESESFSASNSERQEAEEKAASEAQAAKEEAERSNPDTYKTGVTYDQLARTPDDFIGKKVYFTGKVLQSLEDDGETQIRLAVDGDYDNVILVDIKNSKLKNSRILEDDLINVAGLSAGIIKYDSTMGGEISIPSMTGEVIQNQGAAPEDYGY